MDEKAGHEAYKTVSKCLRQLQVVHLKQDRWTKMRRKKKKAAK